MSVLESTLLTPTEYAQELLDLCSDAIAETEGGEIARRYIWTGRPAFDCEQLTVSGVSLGEAPTGALSAMGTGRRHVTGRVNLIGFLVCIVRDCAPQMNGRSAPDPDALTAHASEIQQDVWAVWTAVYRAMREGTLFGGRCDHLFFDGAQALESSGTLSAWEILFRAEILGIIGGGT